MKIKIVNDQWKWLNKYVELTTGSSYNVIPNSMIHGGPKGFQMTSAGVIDDVGNRANLYIPPDGFVGILFEFPKSKDEPDPVLKEWGYYQDLPVLQRSDSNFHRFLYEQLKACGYEDSSDIFNLEKRVTVFQPIRSQLNFGNIAIYQTRDKLQLDKNTSMKPGRAILKMFPELTAAQVSVIVDNFNEHFSEKIVTLHSGKEAEDFNKAYTHKMSEMENPRTTSYRKSLANSCMQKPFEELPMHPVEAYASGDFTIYWTEDPVGNISSRCVVYTGGDDDPQAGPIYGTCEVSISRIEDELTTIDATVGESSNWEGATLVLNRYEGEIVGPYLDVHPRILDIRCDKLIVNDDGEIDGSNHEGILGELRNYHCEYCDDSMSEDDAFYVDDTCMCCYCRDDHYFYCDYADEYVSNEDTHEVYSYSNGYVISDTHSRYECDYSDEIVFVDSIDEYWETNHTKFSEYLSEYISDKQIKDGEYFVSSHDDDVYPIDERVILCDGSEISNDEFESISDEYELNDSTGVQELKEANET